MVDRLLATIYTGLIVLKILAAANYDGLSIKTTKYLIDKTVPVAGDSFQELSTQRLFAHNGQKRCGLSGNSRSDNHNFKNTSVNILHEYDIQIDCGNVRAYIR